ncbi:unnamed protein product, partial [Vitis vinifera]|uniref:Uncharacterized protein n=1 Tax=Vitis vinifera TaxID=29760 RepID=D7U8J1_VITVI
MYFCQNKSLVLKSAQGKEYGCLIIFYKEQRIIVLYKLERKLSQVSSLLLSLSLSLSPVSYILRDLTTFFPAPVSYQLQLSWLQPTWQCIYTGMEE